MASIPKESLGLCTRVNNLLTEASKDHESFSDFAAPKGVETLILCLTVEKSLGTTRKWAKTTLIEKEGHES